MGFVLKKCEKCDKSYQPPVFHCSSCGSSELVETTTDAKGEIHTYTIVQMTFGAWGEKTPYILGIVELDSGMKVTTVIEDGDVENVKIGDQVQFSRYQENGAPIFKMAA